MSNRRTARLANERAGIGRDAEEVAEVHGAAAMGELRNGEASGRVPSDVAGPAIERGEFSIGLGRSHELVTRLRAGAGAGQVAGVRSAAQASGGGLPGFEEAVIAVILFAKG